MRSVGMRGSDNVEDRRRRSRSRVAPNSFTHGTSEQRVRWFRKGLQTGGHNQVDLFQGGGL